MTSFNIADSRILAEILRIQRWAGGEHVSADRIFGLMNGFESVIRQESESFGICEETQDKVENVLADVESGEQSSDGPEIKARLRLEGVEETIAGCIMELCRLQSRFIEGVAKIAKGRGSVFAHLDKTRLPEQDWYGALHYMELVDCTEGGRNKMYAVFAPSVPCVGEIVTPQNGSAMEVIGVDHVVVNQGGGEGLLQNALVPHILLEAISEEDES